MESFEALERQREEMVGIYDKAYDCHKCGGRGTVIEDCFNGTFIGECTACGAHHLDPDWDAMKEEI